MRRVRSLTIPLLLVGLIGAVDPARASAPAVPSTAVPSTAAPAAASTAGAAGAGDPYFPRQGNGGYDVSHYDIRLRYSPGQGERLNGAVHIFATAKQRLSSFHLDLRPNMRVSSAKVNGTPVRYAQPAAAKQELVITPARTIAKGAKFRVLVLYQGHARNIVDPDGSPDGWIKTNDGAFVANEPQGSPTWFPVNDSPRDKATFTVAVNVPKGLAAISNGRFAGHQVLAHGGLWTWQMTRPISSYLVTATVGRFDISLGRTPNGVPYVNAVDPSQKSASAAVLRTLPQIVDFFSSRYGRYPFPQVGAIIDNAPGVGYALETATRPLFPGAPSEATMAHELAHEWFGDTVTLQRWKDIWVNEGFAEFSSWMWDQRSGHMTMRAHLQQLLARPADDSVWNPPPANPGSNKDIFDDSVYERGAGALEALRERLGNQVFFAVMRGWVAKHRFGNATTYEFTQYAEQVSHRQLDDFFFQWLYRKGKPTA